MLEFPRMYVLVSNINDSVVKTRNTVLSKIVERGEELTQEGYGKLIVCEEYYNEKESRTERLFICEIK